MTQRFFAEISGRSLPLLAVAQAEFDRVRTLQDELPGWFASDSVTTTDDAGWPAL